MAGNKGINDEVSNDTGDITLQDEETVNTVSDAQALLMVPQVIVCDCVGVIMNGGFSCYSFAF